jgi:hypothetical protein
MAMMEDLITGWTQDYTNRADLFNFRSAADDPEQSFTELQVDEGLLWSEGMPIVYVALANQVASALSTEEEESESEPHAKRQRLESVVVQRM